MSAILTSLQFLRHLPWRLAAAGAAATFVLAPARAQVRASTPPMGSLWPPGARVGPEHLNRRNQVRTGEKAT
ncbi:hypothetical protein, partial [Sphaerotilus montanus]|uniref:hypothetical protein n=1 Tax=Sphaerotilus montanus TaxID=522889 RepID=UPI003FA1F83D